MIETGEFKKIKRFSRDQATFTRIQILSDTVDYFFDTSSFDLAVLGNRYKVHWLILFIVEWSTFQFK